MDTSALEDDFTGTRHETVRRALARVTHGVRSGCDHPGPSFMSWAQPDLWCAACTARRGLLEAWSDWPTCMCCGRAIGDDRRVTVSRLGPGPAFDVPGRGVAWPAAVSVVVTLCPSCSDELAELASEEDPHDH